MNRHLCHSSLMSLNSPDRFSQPNVPQTHLSSETIAHERVLAKELDKLEKGGRMAHLPVTSSRLPPLCM